MASAKYSSGTDYEQLLHVDYGNHTLVVPRADPGFQHLELFVYLERRDEDTAATRMVSRRLTEHIPVERTHLAIDEYAALYAAEVPATGPGRVGPRLSARHVPPRHVAPPARQGAPLAPCRLQAGRAPIGSATRPGRSRPRDSSWHRFVAKATLRQLVAVGFPEPGHPYWNAETLRGVAARYPSLDMGPWRRALESIPCRAGPVRR